eukprot:3425152-Rhodomonas_salina.2
MSVVGTAWLVCRTVAGMTPRRWAGPHVTCRPELYSHVRLLALQHSRRQCRRSDTSLSPTSFFAVTVTLYTPPAWVRALCQYRAPHSERVAR